MSDLRVKSDALIKARSQEIGTALPSRLIEIALGDLEVVEKNPKYQIDMGKWHEPCLFLCDVCLAGSVIARRLGKRPNQGSDPDDFPPHIRDSLVALDMLRCGHLEETLGLLKLPMARSFGLPDFVEIAPYEYDKGTFKSDMRKLSELLRESSL